jgi:glutathione synthase/RimK-type ligase-like ATP-grasp enzyme/ribosomal protein S18 acetylase RimI-like enzyme
MTAFSAAALVRNARDQDLDALTALEHHAFSGDRIDRRSFRRFLQTGSTRLLVAELPDGTIGGYLILQLPRRTRRARIYSIAVDEKVRGYGLGTQLMLVAEEIARQSHRTLLTLEVRTDSNRVKELYERLGYVVHERLSGYYEDGTDGFRMRKDLTIISSDTPVRGRVPLLVVEKPEQARDLEKIGRVVTVREYLSVGLAVPGRVVVNLSVSYEHMTRGYYVSLLAEARGERCYPAAYNLLDVNWKRIHRRALTELEPQLQRAAEQTDLPESTLIFFGHTDIEALSYVAAALFDQFRCPILEVWFGRDPHPVIEDIEAMGIHRLSEADRTRFAAELARFLKARSPVSKPLPRVATSIAMLVDPNEPVPPSDEPALKRFEQAALDLGARITRIDRHDLHKLAQFDALFIRETTRLDHHTYRFARKAEDERIPVFDTPEAILKCTNKIFLFEMLRAHGIPSPKTTVFDRRDLKTLAETMTYPAVLKVPDSAFSLGVYRVEDADSLRARAEPMFKQSDLLLLQSYVPTAFDWRIGILDGKPLFACRYFMADGHWQIIQHDSSPGEVAYGDWETLPLEAVPASVLQAATEAALPIGRGLFGVDLKETPTGPLVIEVNDNPNIDEEVEDGVLGDELYRRILGSLISGVGGNTGT